MESKTKAPVKTKEQVSLNVSSSLNEMLNEKLNSSNAKTTENLFNRWLTKKNNVCNDELKIIVSVGSIKKALYSESALQIIEKNNL